MNTIYIIHTCKSIIRLNAIRLTGFVLIMLTLSSCKKNQLYDGPLYSIKVFNGIEDGVSLYRNYNGSRPISFRNAGQVANRTALGSNFLEETVVGSFFVGPDTLPKDMPVLRQEINLGSSRINTLYLMGNKNSVDYFFTAPDYKRYIIGDSVTYLTFVNICNDKPVSVNIKGNANGSLVSQLTYKAASDIVSLPVRLSNVTHNIEFRDALTGDSLTTFVLNNSNPGLGYFNTYLYKNSSIVLVGKRGQLTGLNKLEAVRVNHD